MAGRWVVMSTKFIRILLVLLLAVFLVQIINLFIIGAGITAYSAG